MSCILYYSNFCNNCKKLLTSLSKSNRKNDVHFICIDKRIQKNNKTYVVLENGEEILLPGEIKGVPALLLIRENYRILYGDEIYGFLQPIENIPNQMNNMNINQNNDVPQGMRVNSNQEPQQPQQNNFINKFNEPEAFCLSSGLGSGIGDVVSDNYSFLDQNNDEMSTKGTGGMRQLYNYATINHQDKIETPPDDYVPDKIGDVSLENLQQSRNQIR